MRALLVVGGVATGITLIVAIEVINTGVVANVRDMIDTIAGPASLEITLGTGEVGFPEEIATVARDTPGVVAAIPLVRGTVSAAARPDEALFLIGVDFTREKDLELYPVFALGDRRRTLAAFGDPGAILIAEEYARAHRFADGSPLALSTSTGLHRFHVRGLLRSTGLARAFGGRLAVMDLPAAQMALGKGEMVDQVDIVVGPDADVEGVAAALRSRLPAGYRVQRPEQRSRAYENVVRSFQVMLTAISLLCLVAGIFIIYNTTSTGAVHRATALATLRQIGAERQQIFRLLMLEAALLGTVGTAIGIVQGIVLARVLSTLVTDSMGVIFQLRFVAPELVIDSSTLIGATVVGIATAIFASSFSARRISDLDTLATLRGGLESAVSPPDIVRFLYTWLALVLISGVALALQVVQRSIFWGNLGSTLWFASSIVIAVPLVAVTARRLQTTLPRYFGSAGRVAADAVVRNLRRTGITVAAIALVLTIAIAISTVALSFQRSVKEYFSAGFLAADLVVSQVLTEGGWLETPLPASVADEIAAIAGVQGVDLLRILPGQPFRGDRIALAATSDGLVDPKRHPPGWYVEGDAESAASAIRAGTGARISVSLADRFHLGIGDVLELNAPRGRARFEVVGVVPDYMSDRGGMSISIDALRRYWGDELVNRINVYAEPGTDVHDVQRAIEAKLGKRFRLKILTLSEIADYHDRMITRAFSFTRAIQLLVVIVTIAGILDLLFSDILERRRELALWRLTGADHRVVRRSIVLESSAIGTLGALLGVLVGAVTAWMWVRVNFRYLLGYYLDFHFDVTAALWYVVLALVTTMIAGAIAARRATTEPVLEGLRAE